MTNDRLIREIQRGTATPGQLRSYAERVSRRKDAAECEYAHYDCALIHRGPCSGEALSKADDAREKLEQEREARRSMIGKKGGTSATAGKRGFTYSFIMPDGTTGSAVSFKANGVEKAQVLVYLIGQSWYVSGIYETLPDWAVMQLELKKAIYRVVEGTRVTKVSQRHKDDASASS